MRKPVILFFFALAASGQTTFNSSSGLSVTAPTVNQCPSGIGTATLTVSGLSGTISNITLGINGITSNRIGAVNFQLEGPGGQKIVVWRAIGSNTNPLASPGVNVTLSDSAATALPTFDSSPNTVSTNTSYRPAAYSLRTFVIPPDEGASPGFTGCSTPPAYNSAAPVGTATLGGTFNGLTPNGTWKLNMIHNGGTAAGTISISGWSLTLTTAAAAPTNTAITSATNPSLTGSNVAFTATVTSAGNPVTTGTVTFTQGSTTLAANVPLNASGQATANVSFPTEGIRTIVATYNGTGSFGGSNRSLDQEVNNPTTLVSGRYCNTGALTLPGSAATITPAIPYPSKIFLTGVSGSITNVKLYLNGYNHTRPLGVNLLLVSPDGRKFVPMSTVGGTNPAGPLDMVLSDAGPSFISTTALAAGTFLPTAVNNFNVISFPSPAPLPPYQFAQSFGTATFASTFGGAQPTTTWQLFAVTQAAGTGGAFNGGWCLEPSLNSDPPTTTSVSGTPNNSFTVAPDAQVTITANVRLTSNGNPATTGTVNFTQGLTVLGSAPVDANGNASITRTFTSEGDFPVVASYSGATGAFGASSGTYTQIVIARTTRTGTSFCNPGGISIIQPPSITDTASPYPSRIIVPTGIGTLRKVTVSLNGLTHAAANELDMLLLGPTAQNLVFLASAGGSGAVSNANLVFDDAAATPVPQSSTITSNTFRPSSYNASAAFLPPAPAGPYNHAASAGSSTLALFNNTASNGTWQLFVSDKNVGNLGSLGSWCVNLDPYPDLIIAKSHTGNFAQGQTGAQFTITVINTTAGATSGPVTVTENVPQGLTLTGMSGNGWTCPANSNTCSRSDSLGGNSTYPPITATFTVAANAPSLITNIVSVSGGGELNTGNNSGIDTAAVNTRYQLTTAASPSNGGTVTPASGTFYDSGTVVNLMATANPGFVFANWTGPVASASSAATTVTMDAAKSVTANFTAVTPVTINVPAGVGFSFNGTSYTGSQTVQVAPGTYTLATTTPQSLGAGIQAVFVSWSDAGAIAHSVTVGSSAITITGTFKTQYQLTTAASPSNGGTVTPASGTFFDSGTVVNVTATASPGFVFANWTGPVASASAAATTVTMDAAKSVTANFTAQTPVTINVPAGVSFTFNGNTVTGSQTFNVAPGTYLLATTTPQALAAGTRAAFNSWSDAGAISHNVVVGSSAITITGNFTTQYQLTTVAGVGGAVMPASGLFFDAGTVVSVTALPSSGYVFNGWTGPVANAAAASTTLTMTSPATVSAAFLFVSAPNVTPQVTVTLGSVTFNRFTQRYSQTVTVTNNGAALTASALVLDNLTPGYTLVSPSGTTSLATPAGSPYRELGALGAGSTVTVTLDFTRTGSLALTYTPRVLGAGPR